MIDIIVRLEGNLDDTKASLHHAISVLEPPIRQGTLTEIDMSNCRYLGPLVVAYLATVIKRLERVNQRARVTLPPAPASLRAFCEFSGLAHLIGQAGPPQVQHPDNETVPLTLTSSNWRASQPIVDLVARHLGQIPPDFEEALSLCVREVFQNIEDHAESPIGGWYCARFLKNRAETRIAVMDCGLGILRTLVRRHPEITSGQMALRRVVAGECSAQTKPRNKGLGISNLARQVERLQGRALIISQDAYAELSRGRWRYSNGSVFDGTAFFFALPVAINAKG